MTTYTPAAASTRSGFSLDTLRYYERIGLLFDIRRTTGGQRVFTEDDLDWLGVLRCLRDTGMPIADMRRYAELARDGETTYGERLRVLREHAVELSGHIATLLDQQEHLHAKIRWYEQQAEAERDPHAMAAARPTA
ncbi:MerR family transcriptional regulator [Actinacidiphila rubida]|uniref:DNA-binding transcriptional regulator, MerR family n=1 Tax=Actinacidiphila rubida TaxID=310780 RepID=A0A1H8MCR7_9ACTN|nr:MerR family transcriptional regulator [Actinacidiphila rubida]SEO15147.1 DNA-binding transcriptional regulator, MerR family [Actinacidiphila rubida]